MLIVVQGPFTLTTLVIDIEILYKVLYKKYALKQYEKIAN